ncbi:MAG: hypothetical protein B6242_08135 [Anaerolineaceae bacterium 4572_78]|nr:MAG: hypothetical protein B6242_08135 [Anaerolineaceae bacterium 4572_78]
MDDFLPPDRMPEAEIALRLAFKLLDYPNSEGIANVSIDRTQVTVGNTEIFPLVKFLESTGWKQDKQIGKYPWQGQYHKDKYQLNIVTQLALGNMTTVVAGRQVVVQCKSAPLKIKRRSNREVSIFLEVIGKAVTTNPVREHDIMIAAMPNIAYFQKLAKQWQKGILFQHTGIQIVLVGRDGTIEGLDIKPIPKAKPKETMPKQHTLFEKFEEFDKTSVNILRLIGQGRSYQQIMSLHPTQTYMDIFKAATEAVELFGEVKKLYREEAQLHEMPPDISTTPHAKPRRMSRYGKTDAAALRKRLKALAASRSLKGSSVSSTDKKDEQPSSKIKRKSKSTEYQAESDRIPPREYEQWSNEEYTKLANLVRSGKSVEEIASQLQRQVGAVHSRVETLKFMEAGDEETGDKKKDDKKE